VRLFAIEHVHHFASMAIGVAMLGFGASGTLLTLRRKVAGVLARQFGNAALLAAVLLIAVPAAVDLLPFDATQLAVDPRQWAWLAVLEVTLALPFAAGALATLSALAESADRPGGLYGASFVGAGVGALMALAVLFWLEPVRALAAPAVLASLAAIAAAAATERRRLALLSAASAAVATVCLAVPPWSLDITPYKALPQVEAFPGARRVIERTGALGWVVGVEAPAFRHAPGLSLTYTGAFPAQTALFVDAQLAGALTSWTPESFPLLTALPAAIPFALGSRERVLVIGGGEGIEVAAALAHGARKVVAVELNPDLAFLQRGSGNAHAVWIVGDARSYVARTDENFDLVTLGPAGGFGASAGGLHALSEDYLHTVDAYASYLRRLRPGGVLAVTRWLDVPPRESVRVVATAGRALGPERVRRGLVVTRSWGTVTTLAKPDGFSGEEVARLAQWCGKRRFDVDWRPGDVEPPRPRFNRMADPAISRAAAAVVAGTERAFFDGYPFVVEPVTDARPFPHHFLDLGRARRLFAAGRGEWLPFAEWGTLALAATLAQAVVLAGLLTLVPVAVRLRAAWRPGLPRLFAYFAAIGLAYLAAEIAAIQQLALLLGHPVYAVTAVLTVMLICSGAGSVWSDRRREGAAPTFLLAAWLAVYAGGLLGLAHALQPQPLAIRAAAAMAMLVPPAFLMGMPFPIGLRALAAGDPTRVAWAWAMNGFASVVAAPLSALVALEAGTPSLFAVASAAYALAALGLVSRRRDQETRAQRRALDGAAPAVSNIFIAPSA
jgi:SAM-dependent methyltransferase